MEIEVKIALIVTSGVLLFVAIVTGGVLYSDYMGFENFQKTVDTLSSEQKCLYICGFQYPGETHFDNYKYCVEKCDRISERTYANT